MASTDKNEELWSAASSGDLAAVQAAIEQGADINYQDPTLKRTPLWVASKFNHLQVVQKLIQEGADVNIGMKFGATPVFIASQENHTEVLDILIREGADVNIARTDIGFSPLHTASSKGYTKSVVILLEAGADVESCTNEGHRPIHMACQQGHHETALTLISSGCQLQPTDSDGDTPLHLAGENGRLQIGKMLVNEGHDLLVANNAGETPIDIAQKKGNQEFYNWAIKADGHLNHELSYKPAQVRCRQEYELWVHVLMDDTVSNPRVALDHIRNGFFEVHYQDLDRLTAIHHAAASGDLDTIQALVQFGGFPSPVSLSGQTPADLAKEKGHHLVYKFLTEEVQQPQKMDWCQSSHRYHNLLIAISQAGVIENREKRSDIEVQERLFMDIKNMASMLSQGIPLSPPGNTSTELIHMALNNTIPRVMELFLCAGAPLFRTVGTHSVLEMAWLKPTTTTLNAVMITRQLEMNLLYELKQIGKEDDIESLLINCLLEQLGADVCLKNELNSLLPGHDKLLDEDVAHSGYRSLVDIIDKSCYPTKMDKLKQIIEKYGSIKPWRASLKEKIEEIVSQGCYSKEHLLVRASKLGLTSLCWWIWRSGVNTSQPDDKGEFPLLAAISNQHWSTVRYMINYMSTNPFIKSPMGDMPFHLIQQQRFQLSQEISQSMVMAEFLRLTNLISSAKEPSKKMNMKKLCLLLGCLYVTDTFKNSEQQTWQVIYTCSEAILTEQLLVDDQGILVPTEPSKTNLQEPTEDDQLFWVKNLIQKISHDGRSIIEDASLPELVIGLKDLIEITIKPENLGISFKPQIQNILQEALELTCQRRFPLFQHLLISYTGQKADVILNTMLQTRSVHYAAANGRVDALLYLHYTCHVPINVLDRSGNTPSHYSFMNGNINTGNLLISLDNNLRQMKNSSERSPIELKKAYLSRINEVDEILSDENHKEEAKALLKEFDEQGNEYDLADKHMKLFKLNKKSKGLSFRDIALGKLVNFEQGEAKEITQRVIEFVEGVAKKVGELDSLFKGKAVPLGSSADNVRLGAPDEADYNIIINLNNVSLHLENLSIKEKLFSRCSKKIVLKSESDKIKHLLDEKNQIDGVKFREKFFHTVEMAISSMINFEDKRLTIVHPGVKKTGVGAVLTLAWMGTEYPLLLIDVDLVPVIKTQRPEELPHPPLTEHLSWENKDCAHEILMADLKWIFSSQDLNSVYINSNGNNGWRFSTSLLENYVMLNKTSTNQKLVYVILKYIISIFKAESWYSRNLKDRYRYIVDRPFRLPAPQGFLLKTAYFKELEETNSEESWQEKYYLQRIESILKNMTGENGCVKSYFAAEMEKQTHGYMGTFILDLLKNNDINDFIE